MRARDQYGAQLPLDISPCSTAVVSIFLRVYGRRTSVGCESTDDAPTFFTSYQQLSQLFLIGYLHMMITKEETTRS